MGHGIEHVFDTPAVGQEMRAGVPEIGGRHLRRLRWTPALT
jgi:hypothetical protein